MKYTKLVVVFLWLMTREHNEKIQKNIITFVCVCGGVICKLLKLSNKRLTAEQSSEIHIGLTRVLQLWKIYCWDFHTFFVFVLF